MEAVLTAERERRISETVEREQGRLWSFIRRRIANRSDAEDILQDVFSQLVRADPVEQVTAWLYRVASNRIIDHFRKKKPQDLEADEWLRLGDLLPSPGRGPDADYVRGVLLEQLEAAIDELPSEQRDVFLAHELHGKSFRELAEESGIGINTLLSRKHYAVLFLRRRLQDIHEEFER